ncbi:MAG TPA: secretin N-terminal domain-containing protein [Longimicrobium sp.]|jgi:type IV pilus assembly protein PilQ|uniref:secretin N-terminal domain-containing protein n=1 Tax=Longimicrobium sp. TaxID=2029185 RepID=UPI002EDBA67E
MIRILTLLVLAISLAAAPAHAQTGGRRITASFQNVEMRDVVRAFAEFSGTSIVVGPDVAGVVTAEVRNQLWDVALRAIVEAYGFGVQEVGGGLLRIDSAVRISGQRPDAPLVSRAIRLNYVPAESIAAALGHVLTERGSISVLASANAVVVTDTEEAVARVVQLIGHP